MPGASDGTSNKTSPYFDFDCDENEALKPSPEFDTWFDDYFVMLAANVSYIGI